MTAEIAVRDDGAVEADVTDAEVVGEPERPLWGHVIIEWPEPGPKPGPRPLIGWKCSLFNADTGQQFYTCRKIEVHADVDHFVTADLTMFADEDGKPSFDNPHMAQDGNGGQVILEGTFRFLVTGMRTRGTAGEVTPGG